MADFKSGDAVTIRTRGVTGDDVKSGLYYQYFGGLIGNVDRVYDDGSVCVNIDINSLSDEARDRHLAMQEAERKRWLDSLSGEARGRLTEAQRQLKISYKVLVSDKDLERNKGGKPKGSSSPKPESAASEGGREGPARAPDPVRADKASTEPPTPKRLSEADLAAKEEEFLRSLQNRAGSS
ncbi:MAG: hypothetical protein M1133_03795 [Armatimonadetes bacterium]|nr:hypothetical protein [Armatimonadota bacterium]